MAEQTIEALHAWEQQDGESAEAFEAFQVYLAQPPAQRSLRNAAATLQKSDTLIGGWSSKWEWQRRILAHDRHIARGTNREIELGRAEMRSRIIIQAKNIQSRVASRVLDMKQADIDNLKPSECVAMLRLAAELEMKARAIPAAELEDSADRAFSPTFVIEFVPTTPPEFVTARLPDGRIGYIPKGQVEAFSLEFPEAAIINSSPMEAMA